MTKLKAATSWTGHKVWKYFGAMFMEKKNGEMAVSLHKVLGLVMFFWCLWQWSYPDVNADGEVMVGVDSDAVYTLWGLLGLKAVSMFRRSPPGES